MDFIVAADHARFFRRLLRGGEPAVEVGQPGLKFLVEHLEEDRLPAVEIPQHVGLGQADAVGQFPQADVREVLLGQHLACAGHDRRTAGRHLFWPASTLKRHR